MNCTLLGSCCLVNCGSLELVSKRMGEEGMIKIWVNAEVRYRISSGTYAVFFLAVIAIMTAFAASSYAYEPVEGDASFYDVPSLQDVKKAKDFLRGKFENGFHVENHLERRDILSRYDHLDPEGVVPRKLFDRAVLYYDQNISSLENRDYITIVDFDMSSKFSRFFVVDVSSGYVRKYHTSHGIGGDADHDGYVEGLGNVPRSRKSSKGFYYVNETYFGKYGRSIRLDGLSPTNNNVRSRAIVIHAADYVTEEDVIQGRSWGCFALSWEVKDEIVDLISGGSLLYAERSSAL